MNIIKKLRLSGFFILFSCVITAQANIFLDAARVQVDKVTDKKPEHKPSLEFKQAVIRYVKNTDLHYFQKVQRNSDENVAYKKELRYLFKNYGSFSAVTLLSRLRSAHQTMVKQDTNVDGDAYRQYEQISSALLLTVSQVFYNEMRNHILHALHDIDNLLVYWHYQHNHQLYYFFHKSPAKWLMGKKQEKEVAHNIIKLERKQQELYTLLGALSEHVHSFTTFETTYEGFYVWIERLFEITAGIKINSYYVTDESRFDELAAVLELKLKRVSNFKTDYLASIATTKRPSRLARNWMLYTTVLAALAYAVHYNAKNPEVMPAALKAVQDEASNFLILLLHPVQKIYERGKQAFSMEKKVEGQKKPENEVEKEADNEKKKEPIDKEAQLKQLIREIVQVGKETEAAINEELEKSTSAVRKDGLNELKKAIELMKDPQDGGVLNVGHSIFEYDDAEIKKAIEQIKTVIDPIKENGIVINQQEVDQYKNAVQYVISFVDTYSKKMGWTTEYGRSVWFSLNWGNVLIRADSDFLTPLQKYTKIIDQKILRIFQLAAAIVENIGDQAIDLITETKQLEKDAAEELQYINKQLKDHELTLMFTSLIPLAITALAGSKAYQWATTRDYSSIRIALSDVNALLIEAAHNLDDYHYGKLVYLICKLRHKATYLKDSLANEFLDDVAKLESKQYSAQTKHDIVENMFNKYAFLGRIAI